MHTPHPFKTPHRAGDRCEIWVRDRVPIAPGDRTMVWGRKGGRGGEEGRMAHAHQNAHGASRLY